MEKKKCIYGFELSSGEAEAVVIPPQDMIEEETDAVVFDYCYARYLHLIGEHYREKVESGKAGVSVTYYEERELKVQIGEEPEEGEG